jgi:hypothetical protein
MSFVKKYSDKLYMKQWGLGFLRASIADIIRNKRTDLSFEWLPLANRGVSQADPFLFKSDDGRLNILFESVSTTSLDGKISLIVCNEALDPVLQKDVLTTKDHLSYPFVYRENGTIYVFPESAFSGSLYCYEYDQLRRSFANKREILKAPLLDSTILKYENRYWLFATMLGANYNSDLHIFYSDHLLRSGWDHLPACTKLQQLLWRIHHHQPDQNAYNRRILRRGIYDHRAQPE